MAERSIVFVADFTIDTLARLVENLTLPGTATRIQSTDPVMATLAAGGPGPDTTAVVWTRPEAIAERFQRALSAEDIDVGGALDETRAFAAALAQYARRTRATLVPAWVLPPWHRGWGALDLRPGVGIAALLNRMNQELAEALRDVPNAFVLDTPHWLSAIGPKSWSDKAWYAAKSPFSAPLLEYAAAEIAAAVDALDGTARRIVIVDLDEVLWGGVVGETGWEGLTLGGHNHVGEAYAEFQRALKALTRRGIQLAIVSKNDEAVALEAIDRHPEMALRRDDFAAWRINWDDKAANVAALLADVGLGAEAAVFIDDSAVERARVAGAIPGILVPEWPSDPARYREALAQLRCFDTTAITSEDRSRTRNYAAERVRRGSLAASANVEGWIASLGVTVAVEPLSRGNLERSAQLLNKTNQMNLATRRLSAAELSDWASFPDRIVLTFRVADRFGDSGLTGIVGLECCNGTAQLVDYLLSCRVMGRRVEETMLHVAVVEAGRRGARELRAAFQPTPRNGPCLAFLQRSGLRTAGDNLFTWDVAEPFECPTSVTLVTGGWK